MHYNILAGKPAFGGLTSSGARRRRLVGHQLVGRMVADAGWLGAWWLMLARQAHGGRHWPVGRQVAIAMDGMMTASVETNCSNTLNYWST